MTDRTVAVCTWSLRAEDSAELVREVAQTGLNAVQLALSPMVTAPDRWGDAADRLQDAGITVVSGMMALEGEDYSTLERIAETGGVRPDATWPANRDHAAAVAELAADLGLELVTFHAGFIPHDEGPEREKLVERLRTVVDDFENLAIDVAFETGQETAATLGDALYALDLANLGVNFDPANMILYGMGDPVEAVRHLSPWVMQVHIKDALPAGTPGTWGQEVAVGDGAVDWPAFLKITDDLDVVYVIEREAGETRIEDIRRAAALLESIEVSS